jgi:hypothetical protein
MGQAENLVTALLELTDRRDRSGVFVALPRCEFCDLPAGEKYFSDRDTMDAGLGVRLCARQRCIEERDAMPVSERLNVYLAMTCSEKDWRR